MEFKEKLKKLRLEKGLSQQRRADAIYVSRSAVAKWENGLGLPSEESLELVARFFEIPTEDLKPTIPRRSSLRKTKACTESPPCLAPRRSLCFLPFPF